MKLKLDVYLKGLKKEANRQIFVNDSLTLQEFCEYVILAMNGDCKHLYQLIVNEEYGYLGPGCYVYDSMYEEMMDDLTLEDIYFEVGDTLLLNYDFTADWDIVIKIKDIKNGYLKKDFEIVSGYGKGIIENIGHKCVKEYLKSPANNKWKTFSVPNLKELEGYYEEVNIEKINSDVDKYVNGGKDKVNPKNYIMNIALDGFEKEIKRKVAVDSKLNLNLFCRAVIIAMHGDLSHAYGIKVGKEYLKDEVIERKDLCYLELKEKQRLQVIYDFGDRWTFKITVSKINDGYDSHRKFRVLSGKGYGIIDDCGGTYELEDIFNKENTRWGEYDINDFDMEKINKNIDMYM